MKVCARCDQKKALDEFDTQGGRKSPRAWCKECSREYNRQYRLDNLERCREQNRDGHKRRRYGDPDYYRKNHARAAAADPDYYRKATLRSNFRMTLEDYDAKLTAQGGVCTVCGASPGGKRLEVDHDRTCCPGNRSCGNCIRDLLCSGCNGGTGIVDNPDLLRRKAAYLLEWRIRHGATPPQ